MTPASPQPPSALPLDLGPIRERHERGYVNRYGNVADLTMLDDIGELFVEIDRLRALVPLPQSDVAWQRELFIAAIRTLREQCQVNANSEASSHAYRERQHTFMLHLDDALRIIDEPSAAHGASASTVIEFLRSELSAVPVAFLPVQDEAPTEEEIQRLVNIGSTDIVSRFLADAVVWLECDLVGAPSDNKSGYRIRAERAREAHEAWLNRPVGVQDEAPKAEQADATALMSALVKISLMQLDRPGEGNTYYNLVEHMRKTATAGIREYQAAAALGASRPSPADRQEEK